MYLKLSEEKGRIFRPEDIAIRPVPSGAYERFVWYSVRRGLSFAGSVFPPARTCESRRAELIVPLKCVTILNLSLIHI